MLKLCITFLIFAGMADLSAQLSPGDLANAHKNLEGLENCTKCHEIGKKVLPEKCLKGLSVNLVERQPEKFGSPADRISTGRQA